jgi:hypothetical protein
MRRAVLRVATLVALSASALLAQAAPQTLPPFQGEAAEEFLTKARIVSTRPIGEGVTRPFRVTMELNGLEHMAIFKSIDERKSGVTTLADGSSEIDFQDSWQTEIAGYIFDRMIGLGMVPATVKRRVDGKMGSVQWFVAGMIPESERIEKKLSAPDQEAWSEQVYKVRLFDELIANADRHLKNIQVTSDFQIRLIDHSRTFRVNRALKDPNSLQKFSRSLLESIKKLDKKGMQARLGEYLTGAQIERVLNRRDAIVKLAEQRVKEKGEAAVLYK